MSAANRSPRFTTLMCGAIFIYFVACLFPLPALFFMPAALVLAPLVSYALAAGGLAWVRAERRLPSRLWPDEQVEVELRIENHAWLPKCLLQLEEQLPAGLQGDPDDPPGCVVPMLWADTFSHRYPLVAQHRGRYQLPPVQATALDAFDLFRARRTVGPANEVVVYPRRLNVAAHTLHAPNLDGLVQRRRPTASGTDFRATREYLPGDDLRRVHWRSTARRGEAIVVEFEEPATTDLCLVLDASPAALLGSGRDDTFETAVTLAASLVEHELERGNAVGLVCDHPDCPPLPLTRERHDRLRFFEQLAVVAATSPRPFTASLELAAELVPTAAVALILSPACDDATLLALRALTRQHAVAYVWIDPAGYPDAAPVAAEGFLSSLKTQGATVFRVGRENPVLGLSKPL
ncbi:MAG: DUF58 domain-containing protein [Fimbriimonadaceae bacterium]|nr:DUF58 domain-containing protein [Fimbriimonadaceae bacterium]